MTNSENITPNNSPGTFVTFIVLADNEVCGFLQLPVASEAMIAGLRSGNVSIVEVQTGSIIPQLLSTWDGENFSAPPQV